MYGRKRVAEPEPFPITQLIPEVDVAVGVAVGDAVVNVAYSEKWNAPLEGAVEYEAGNAPKV